MIFNFRSLFSQNVHIWSCNIFSRLVLIQSTCVFDEIAFLLINPLELKKKLFLVSMASINRKTNSSITVMWIVSPRTQTQANGSKFSSKYFFWVFITVPDRIWFAQHVLFFLNPFNGNSDILCSEHPSKNYFKHTLCYKHNVY